MPSNCHSAPSPPIDGELRRAVRHLADRQDAVGIADQEPGLARPQQIAAAVELPLRAEPADRVEHDLAADHLIEHQRPLIVGHQRVGRHVGRLDHKTELLRSRRVAGGVAHGERECVGRGAVHRVLVGNPAVVDIVLREAGTRQPV